MCCNTSDRNLVAIGPGCRVALECGIDRARVALVEGGQPNICSVPSQHTIAEEEGDVHSRTAYWLQWSEQSVEILAHSSVGAIDHELSIVEYESRSKTTVVASAPSAILSKAGRCGSWAGRSFLTPQMSYFFALNLRAPSSRAYGQKNGALCWNVCD